MKRSTDSNEDFLRDYLNPETIEKAPYGLSQKIMFQVLAQKKLSPLSHTFWHKYSVPVVSGSITAVFLIITLILPHTGDNTFKLSVITSLVTYKDLIQKFSINMFSGFRLPVILIYIMMVVFMLSILDYILDYYFRRNRGLER